MSDRKRARSPDSEEADDNKRIDAYDMTTEVVPEDDVEPAPADTLRGRVLSGRECPDMDTIDRSTLDFDLARSCSVSSVLTNIYACLVCGKYFQGRGPHSHAYFHALHTDHHLFINLETEKVLCIFVV